MLIAMTDDEAYQGSMLILQFGDSKMLLRRAQTPGTDRDLEFRSI